MRSSHHMCLAATELAKVICASVSVPNPPVPSYFRVGEKFLFSTLCSEGVTILGVRLESP